MSTNKTGCVTRIVFVIAQTFVSSVIALLIVSTSLVLLYVVQELVMLYWIFYSYIVLSQFGWLVAIEALVISATASGIWFQLRRQVPKV